MSASGLRLAGGAALLAAALLAAAPARAECRQALALGLDISGSVNEEEYRLQLDGLAEALLRPAVREALFALPGAPIDLAVFEWSGPGDTRIIQDWITLADETALSDLVSRLRATSRRPGEPSTAIGTAMLYGDALLRARSWCWRRVLDLSGDGKSNAGPRPRDVRAEGRLGAITINALVIGRTEPRPGIAELSAYFRAEVIHGHGAFVETALGFEDYARAMERKLVREIEAIAIGALSPRAR